MGMRANNADEVEAEPVERPTRCPACGASDLTTTSKAQDRHSYWRCLTCGEVWNLERRAAGSRFSYRR
jgi:transposase-like protein